MLALSLLMSCAVRANVLLAVFIVPLSACGSGTNTPPSPMPETVLLEPDAGDIPRDGSVPWTPNGPRICHSRHLGSLTEHQLLECPANIVNETVVWRPDAIVVLGGGILGPGQPGCATTQRAFAAHQLYEALDRAPSLLLSGHGPVEPARPVDEIEALCVGTRLQQELTTPELDRATRATIDAESAQLATMRAAPLTEADYMCAAILAFYPQRVRPAVLTHMLFEPRSTSTIENANYSTSILSARHIARALILSTPVVHSDHSVDNHPARALEDFRRDRKHGVHSTRLAAAGCPFIEGGPPWSEFE